MEEITEMRTLYPSRVPNRGSNTTWYFDTINRTAHDNTMRIQSLNRVRQSLSPAVRHFSSKQSESTNRPFRYFPHGFTIPSPSASPAASRPPIEESHIKHSPVSKHLASGYELGGHLKKIPESLEAFDENGLMRWGAVGIPLTMITSTPSNNTFTHRL